MKFLIDESADARLAAYLQGLGHDAATVAKDFAPSIEDSRVLAIANREQRILIANDRDFGELVFRLGHPHFGVIFFRLKTTSLETLIGRLNDVLDHYTDSLHQFLIVTEQNVRIGGSRQP